MGPPAFKSPRASESRSGETGWASGESALHLSCDSGCARRKDPAASDSDLSSEAWLCRRRRTPAAAASAVAAAAAAASSSFSAAVPAAGRWAGSECHHSASASVTVLSPPEIPSFWQGASVAARYGRLRRRKLLLKSVLKLRPKALRVWVIRTVPAGPAGLGRVPWTAARRAMVSPSSPSWRRNE